MSVFSGYWGILSFYVIFLTLSNLISTSIIKLKKHDAHDTLFRNYQSKTQQYMKENYGKLHIPRQSINLWYHYDLIFLSDKLQQIANCYFELISIKSNKYQNKHIYL